MITTVPRAALHLQTFARQRMDQTLASRVFTAGIWQTNAAWTSVGALPVLCFVSVVRIL
jgi:hypothetical protein